jgi:hypothetical protein
VSAPIEGKKVGSAVTVKKSVEASQPLSLKVDKQPVYQVDMRSLAPKKSAPPVHHSVHQRTEKPRPSTAEPSRGAEDLIKQATTTVKQATRIAQAKRGKVRSPAKKVINKASTVEAAVKTQKPKADVGLIIKQSLAEQKVLKMKAKTEAERLRQEEEAKQALLKEFAEYTRENNAYSKQVPFKPKVAWGADERRQDVKEDQKQRTEAKAERERMRERRAKVQEQGRERIGLAAYLDIVKEHNPDWKPKTVSEEPLDRKAQPRSAKSPEIQLFMQSQKRQRKAKALEDQRAKEMKELRRIEDLKRLQEASRSVYSSRPKKVKLGQRTRPASVRVAKPLTELSVSAISGSESRIEVVRHSRQSEPRSVEIQPELKMFDDLAESLQSERLESERRQSESRQSERRESGERSGQGKSTEEYSAPQRDVSVLEDEDLICHIKAMDPPVESRQIRKDPFGVWNPASFTLGEELHIQHLSTEAKLKQQNQLRLGQAQERLISIRDRIEAGVPSLKTQEEEEVKVEAKKPEYSQLLSQETVLAKPPPTQEQVKEAVFRKLNPSQTAAPTDEDSFEIPGAKRLEVERAEPKQTKEVYREPPELQTIMSSYKFGESYMSRDMRFLATESVPEMITGTKSSFQHSIRESIADSPPKKTFVPSDEFSTEDEFSVVGLLVKDFFTTPPEESAQEYSQDFEDASEQISESFVESSHESSSKPMLSITESLPSLRKLARVKREVVEESSTGKRSSGTIPEDIESKQSYEEDFESISESLKQSMKRTDSYDDDCEVPSSRSPVKASFSISGSLKRGGQTSHRLGIPDSSRMEGSKESRVLEVLTREHRSHYESLLKAHTEQMTSMQDRNQTALREMMQQMMAFCSNLASGMRQGVSPVPSHSLNRSPERHLAPITPERRLISHKKLTSDDSIHTIYSDDFEPTESVESLRSSSADLLRRKKDADTKLKSSLSKESFYNSDSEKSLSRPSPQKVEVSKPLKLSESAVSISEEFDLQGSEDIRQSLEHPSQQLIKTTEDYSDDFEQSSARLGELKKTQDKYSISSSLQHLSESDDYSEDFESAGESLYKSEDKLRIRPVPSIPEIEHSEEQSEQSVRKSSEVPSEEELSEEIYDEDFEEESLSNSIPKSSRDFLRESKDSQSPGLKSSLEEDVEASSSSQVEWLVDLEPRSIDPLKQTVVDEASAEHEITESEVEEEPDAYRQEPEAQQENQHQMADNLWAQLLQQEVDLALRLLQGAFEEEKVSQTDEVDLMLGRLTRHTGINERLATPVHLDPLAVLNILHNNVSFNLTDILPQILPQALLEELPRSEDKVAVMNQHALFDAVGEAALANLPGGYLGMPQPWSSRTVQFGTGSSSSERIKKTISSWSSTRLGILPDDSYRLVDGRIDEEKLLKDRDRRTKEVVEQEIIEEDLHWTEYDLADAQTRLDLGDYIFDLMVGEAVEILNLGKQS